ncbi:S phase cyclin A-associated protein in the endoplasmic reticulum isoform X2 [Drosophila miranda]|uniref:S phase cyclin A-associated protein in the endoplasmic reticulum isoform X2 n=1 Tax=Drosophila miranda TaxID=7229 RepID=UPI0007E8A1FF|nr:S phase cyclin A-associated protein in the endoplasmic reticulum isoform X2 [Drosophila miranda]
MEMREVLSREGREAKNLLVYQFCDETSTNSLASVGGDTTSGGVIINGDCYRKPPMAPTKSPLGTPKSCQSPTSPSVRMKTAEHSVSGPRVRSASTGRDKKSELQARYWALLFGNLQRAVNEIYQTVECYENISSCQETILVLENYVRDFKALSEWFKVSWDYDSRPLQQRPQSLAWEVRKSNPLPRVRTKSLCSPNNSGKSSPALFGGCQSGKTSPCYDGHVSPKKLLRAYDQMPRGAMRLNVRELFASNKRATQGSAQSDPMEAPAEGPLDLSGDKTYLQLNNQYSQTDLEDPHLTLADVREKMRLDAEQHEAAEREAAAKAEAEAAEIEEAAAAEIEEAAATEIEEAVAAEIEEAAAIQIEGIATEIEAAAATDIEEAAAIEIEGAAATEIEGAAATEIEEAAAKEQAIPAEAAKTEPEPVQPPTQRTEEAQPQAPPKVVEPTALQMTVASLELMENALLAEQANKEPTPPSTVVKPVSELFKKPQPPGPATATGGHTVQNSPLKYSSVLNRPVKKGVSAPAAGTLNAKAAAVPAKPINSATKAAPAPASAPAPAPGVNGLRRGVKASPIAAKTGRSAVQPPPRPSSKTECYGPPNNVASRLSARSSTMLDMNGKANGNAHVGAPLSKALPKRSTITLVANQRRNAGSSKVSSREYIGSSTSTLKASNEQLSSSRSTLKIEDRHSEPKQLQQKADADDGWLTVKNRRRSSMHWSNRFNQPTGYASLPTLALLNEQQREKEDMEKQQQQQQQQQKAKARKPIPQTAKTATATTEASKGKGAAVKTSMTAAGGTRPEIKNAKAKVNSFSLLKAPARRPEKPEKHLEKAASACGAGSSLPATATIYVAARTSTIKRQKSDLTGLKMTSLHKEYMRSEKNALRKQQQKEHDQDDGSSTSVETVVELSNDEHHKIDIKIQTNCEFSKTIGELYESIARCKLPNGCLKPEANTLSACDENDEQNTDDNEEERDERILVEEQESLERQIRELEQTEIDVDTETDETDCEVQLDLEQEDFMGPDDAAVFVTMSDDENASLELRYQALLSDMSWNERAEALATLQAYVARHPGRAQELHQKLSSPSRRRSLQETLKKYQAKQARAHQKRVVLQQEKAAKLQQLFDRVEDVKAAKKQLIEDKRLKMQGRLQRAAENRENYLKQIIVKAHDEDKKLKEINFIKNMEAQNKRLDLLESSKEIEGRLQELEQERQKRVDEKLAKEAAVERRRQALEKERLLKLEKMNETRLEKEQRIGKMQEQKERQRQALAREKARDREERLLALQVQQQQTTEELQRKIQQKQVESARRHEENIEHIRQRAQELTMPTRQPEDGRGDHEGTDEALSHTSNTEDGDMSSSRSDVGGTGGHSRSYKKKMKKLKQRMSQNAAEYLDSMEPTPAFVRRDSAVPKILNMIVKGGGPQGMDRALGNLLRILPKAQTFDFQAFLCMDALGILTNHVITEGLKPNSEVSIKSVHLAVQLYRTSCSLCPQIARHGLMGNSITALLDAINKSLQFPEEKSRQHPVELSTELMLACTEALSSTYLKKDSHPKVKERLPDLINYAVITGLIDLLSRRNQKVRESIEQNNSMMLDLLTSIGFISRFIDICKPGPADPTRLLSAVKSTELFGTLTMLSGSIVPIGDCIPQRTTALAAATFNLYVSLAALDVNTFQEALSVEGPLSLKLLDVIMIILDNCVTNTPWIRTSERTTMLIDLVASLAFFALNNRRHQELLISEPYSAIFKNLGKLSTQFNPVIYPLLVTASFNYPAARELIGKHFDLQFLDEYSRSDVAKRNRLIKLINIWSKDKVIPPQLPFKGG